MTTRYILDVVMLALPEGQHSLSDLEIADLCRGDTPRLERRSLRSMHAGVGAGQRAHAEAMREPTCVMAALIEWTGKGMPDIASSGTLQVAGNPRLTVMEFWERPYRAKLSRYGFAKGITVKIADWQRGADNVGANWAIGGGEWPVWTPPAYPS